MASSAKTSNAPTGVEVAAEELKDILNEVNGHILSSPDNSSSSITIAGVSVASTFRGLAAGFGVDCGIIGASGDDQQGSLFRTNMSFHKVDLSRLRLMIGSTAQCVCLVDELGNRTMRSRRSCYGTRLLGYGKVIQGVKVHVGRGTS